ncbi:unnamed protein product [Sphagnum jensenii]|uniref:Uncharacterized protein n=1 Tax=Sphagnum jensenii TaxID=128206 RepID=A0ABP1BK87_9BRYO
MAEEYEETKKNSTVPEVVDQKQVQLGIADEQAHEENQLELGKSGPLPRGIASYNADAAPVAAHEDDGEEFGEQQQQEAPDQYPASSGINGAQEAGTDFGPDVEPKHKLHSEDEPLPADGDYHDVGDDDDGGIAATGARVDAAEVQRSSSENDTVTAVTHGHGEQETGLAAADEQPKVTDGTDVETPVVEEKYSTVEEDRDGGVNPGGVGDDGGDSTGAGDGGASTGAGDDEEPSFENATEATRYGEEEKTAVPAAADEQPSSQVTDGTDVAETPAAEEKPTETKTKTNPVVDEEKTAVPAAADEQPSSQATDGTDVAETPAAEEKPTETKTKTNPVVDEEKTAVPAAADEQPSSQATDGTDVAETPAAEEKPTETKTKTNPVVDEEKTAVPAAADEQPSSQATDGTDVTETPAAEEKPTETKTKTNPVVVDDEEPRFDEAATRYGEEEKTAVPAAADEQPSSQVTDGTDVAETPAAEEKPTEIKTKTNPVVVDDEEPRFDEAATKYGEEEKTAVPAAAADEQPSSQATDGTDVAETPAAEEKPAETETETNPVVDGDTPTPTTTPATPPTTNTTEEEEPHKKEGFFSKLKDTVTFHHHHKSGETDEEGFFAKLKDKVTFHHHHPTKSVEEENNTSIDNVTPKEVTSH